MTSDVSIREGELSLDAGVRSRSSSTLVISKLDERARDAQRARAATKLDAPGVASRSSAGS